LQELKFTLSNGITLAAHAYGDPHNPPVLLSHGGGQTRHSWGATAEALSQHGWYALAYDHRGHGNSSWSSDGDYDIARFAEDQRELAGKFSAKPVLVGASLGGLAAIVAQGESPEEVFRAIILVDIVPHMNPDGAANIINFMGTHLDDGFSDLEEAADVIAQYTGRPRRKDVSGLKKNLRLGEDGRYRWHWDPQFVNQRQSKEKTTNPDRMTVAAQNITLPMLLVRGQLSDLVTQELAEGFLTLVPHAKYVDVENARHMVAGDRNDIFGKAIEDFLSELENDEGG
jgi:pimeloyl-ACP methyl ester carboxylesterase